ncbi:unnamed protein product [Chrysoparadoxa australica]
MQALEVQVEAFSLGGGNEDQGHQKLGHRTERGEVGEGSQRRREGVGVEAKPSRGSCGIPQRRHSTHCTADHAHVESIIKRSRYFLRKVEKSRGKDVDRQRQARSFDEAGQRPQDLIERQKRHSPLQLLPETELDSANANANASANARGQARSGASDGNRAAAARDQQPVPRQVLCPVPSATAFGRSPLTSPFTVMGAGDAAVEGWGNAKGDKCWGDFSVKGTERRVSLVVALALCGILMGAGSLAMWHVARILFTPKCDSFIAADRSNSLQGGQEHIAALGFDGSQLRWQVANGTRVHLKVDGQFVYTRRLVTCEGEPHQPCQVVYDASKLASGVAHSVLVEVEVESKNGNEQDVEAASDLVLRSEVSFRKPQRLADAEDALGRQDQGDL